MHYVAGATGRSIGRIKICIACKNLLVAEEIVEENLHHIELESLVNLVNHGGLAYPIPYCYAIMLCLHLYISIILK